MKILLPLIASAVPNHDGLPPHTLQMDRQTRNYGDDTSCILLEGKNAPDDATSPTLEGGPDDLQVVVSSTTATAETIRDLPNRTFFSLIQKLLPSPATKRKERSMLAETLLKIQNDLARPYADFLANPEIIQKLHIAKVTEGGKTYFVVSFLFSDEVISAGLNQFFQLQIPASTDRKDTKAIRSILDASPLDKQELMNKLDITDRAGKASPATPFVYQQSPRGDQPPIIGNHANSSSSREEIIPYEATLPAQPNTPSPGNTGPVIIPMTPQPSATSGDDNASGNGSTGLTSASTGYEATGSTLFDITNEQAQKLHKNYPTLFPTGIDAKQLTRDLAGHLCQLKKGTNRVGAEHITFVEQVETAQQLLIDFLRRNSSFEVGNNGTFILRLNNLGKAVTLRVTIDNGNSTLPRYEIK